MENKLGRLDEEDLCTILKTMNARIEELSKGSRDGFEYPELACIRHTKEKIEALKDKPIEQFEVTLRINTKLGIDEMARRIKKLDTLSVDLRYMYIEKTSNGGDIYAPKL